MKLELDALEEEYNEEAYCPPVGVPSIPLGVKLHDYQIEAIKNWVNNDYCGIFDMATGTGKTFTGLGAVAKLVENKKRAAIIIVCPYQHLVEQWVEDIVKFNIKPIIAVDIAGKLQISEKISGRKKAINKLIEIIRQNAENVSDFPIGIVYTNNLADAMQLEEKLYEYFGQDIQLFKVRMTPSNCALLGTGVLGISFHVHCKIH